MLLQPYILITAVLTEKNHYSGNIEAIIYAVEI